VQSVRRILTKRKTRDRLSSLLRTTAKVIAVLVLPFVVYVRTSVFFYQHGWPAWLSIGAGMVLTIGVVALYATWLSRRFHGQQRFALLAKWVAVPLALTWCLYAAFYLARVNAKSDEVHAYYSSVHPLLRVALSTVILVAPDLVITDMSRVPADYPRMGLPVNERTKHYVQSDGWVHAVDLRTRERGEMENRSVQLYFWLMGFSTLRHVGTADHLHVQLKGRGK
jgi:hypothetical protein